MIIAIETTIDQHTVRSIDSLDVLESYGLSKDSYNFQTILKMFEDLKTPERAVMGGGVTHVAPRLRCSMRIHNLNRDKLALFIDTYGTFLAANMLSNPEAYMATFEFTFTNMKWAIITGTFNKDSDSFKQTCKALKIKNTYKAIDKFLERKK